MKLYKIDKREEFLFQNYSNHYGITRGFYYRLELNRNSEILWLDRNNQAVSVPHFNELEEMYQQQLKENNDKFT